MANQTTKLERVSLPADSAPDLRDIFHEVERSESVPYIRSVIARLLSEETRDRITGLLGKDLSPKDELSRSNLVARVAELRSARVELGKGIRSIASYFSDGRSDKYQTLNDLVARETFGLSKDAKGTITDSRSSPMHLIYPEPANAERRQSGFMQIAKEIDQCLEQVDPQGKLTKGAVTTKLNARTTIIDEPVADGRSQQEREALFARIFEVPLG